MSRALDDLDPRFRPLAFQLLARATEAKIPLLVVDTLRTEAEHRVNLANGTSGVSRSRHLPNPPSGLSLAIDVVPYDEYRLRGPDKLAWDTSLKEWDVLGAIGERLGLRWGGRWFRPADPGHFEFVADDATRLLMLKERARRGPRPNAPEPPEDL